MQVSGMEVAKQHRLDWESEEEIFHVVLQYDDTESNQIDEEPETDYPILRSLLTSPQSQNVVAKVGCFPSKPLPEPDIEISILDHSDFRCLVRQCDQSFGCETDRDQHMTITHRIDLPPYECVICQLTFEGSINLELHFTISHPEVRLRYQCSVCHAWKANFGNLFRHKARAHGKDNGRPRCGGCKVGFRNHDEMRIHFRDEHRGWRFRLPFHRTCLVCGVTLTRKADTRRHRLIMHADMHEEHLCVLCPMKFRSRKSLIRHLKTGVHHRHVYCPLCDPTTKFSSHDEYNAHFHGCHGEYELESVSKLLNLDTFIPGTVRRITRARLGSKR